jgi:hypothetical protein
MQAGHYGLRAQRFRFPRGVWGIALAGLMACFTWHTNAADDTGSPQGLRGILPATVPADLVDALSELPESWTDWSGRVSAELVALYETPNVNSAAQRQ